MVNIYTTYDFYHFLPMGFCQKLSFTNNNSQFWNLVSLLKAALTACMFICFGFSAQATLVVTYPQQSFSDGYPIALLKLALERSELANDFDLRESQLDVQQGRALMLLRKNVEVNVAWSMTSKDREQGLRAIKIPIYKGLYGYRIFLINEKKQPQFSSSLPLQKLQNDFVAVQANDWPDTKVLQQAKFNVLGVEQYESMFELLSKNRVDYFPRSILEIWREERRYRTHGITVEKNLALSYSAYVFFFVHPQNTRLGDAIETGLRAAIVDGSFDILFNSIEGNAIIKSALEKRTIFPLENNNVDDAGVYQWPVPYRQ